VPSSAINRDKLNNSLYDAPKNNNLNQTVHIIVDVLQSTNTNTIEKWQTKRYRPQNVKSEILNGGTMATKN